MININNTYVNQSCVNHSYFYHAYIIEIAFYRELAIQPTKTIPVNNLALISVGLLNFRDYFYSDLLGIYTRQSLCNVVIHDNMLLHCLISDIHGASHKKAIIPLK